MEEVNLGGLRLDIKATGIDETLEKLDRLNILLREANSLVSELAVSEVKINFVNHQSEQGQGDS